MIHKIRIRPAREFGAALGVFGLGAVIGFSPTLEQRVSTLEKKLDACCTQSLAPSGTIADQFPEYVELKRRITNLEKEKNRMQRDINELDQAVKSLGKRR